MLLDYIGLLYELSLILAHDLMLALMTLYEQHCFFYHTNCIQASCIYQLSFFLVRMVNHYANHASFYDVQHLLQVYILYYYFYHSFL